MVRTHDYGEPSVVIVQPLVVSFLEDHSHLIVENGGGDQGPRHPEPTLRFGTVLETRGRVLRTMHLTRPRYVEQIQSHGCFEGWMVWRYHRLKHTKAWLRVILVDDFLRHTLCRDLSYEIQETLSISDIILRLLANQVWRGSAFYPQLNHQNNSYFEGYTTR